MKCSFGFLIAVCCFLILLIGCASSSVGQHEWRELSLEKLKSEVEEESNLHQVWAYCGSDGGYHYFARQPHKKFAGNYYYCKIRKAGFPTIKKNEEKVFDGRGGVQSFAFSKMAMDRSGFTHLLSRGLVENVLIP